MNDKIKEGPSYKRLFIIVLSLFFGIVLYYEISININTSPLNEKKYFYINWSDLSSSEDDANRKGLLISYKKVTTDILFDSLNILNNTEVWLCKWVIHNKYGFSELLHFVDTSRAFCELYIQNKDFQRFDGDLCFYEDGDSNSLRLVYNSRINLIAGYPHDTVCINLTEIIDAKHWYSVGRIRCVW